jgi:carboxymethylenebutenolidase
VDDPIPIPRPGETIAYGDPGDDIVVVLHDWYGRLPGLEPYAQALGSRQFRVLVPDLYDGVCTTDDETAAQLMGRLDVGTALALVDDAIEDARIDEPGARVGVVGFSMGGWLALLHAQAGGSDAVVAYSASLAPAEHGVIPCPVLLHWAERDHWEEGEEPEAFMGRLREHGTPVSSHTYPGTAHSFANASIPDRVDANAAALAFVRTAVFLEEHLQGA